MNNIYILFVQLDALVILLVSMPYLSFLFLGLTSSSSKLPRDPSPVFDPNVRSDMLMSIHPAGGSGDPEMSVQQSLHIGVAAGDLQVAKIRLLSDEEMAKG